MADPAPVSPPVEEHLPMGHVLTLPDSKSLVIGTDELAIRDSAAARRSRIKFCGIPITSPPPYLITIPHYNVLWAEIVADKLVIDYASETKKQLRPAQLRFDLRESPMGVVVAWIEILLKRAYGKAQRKRRAKVLVNPHAGPGGAVRLWEHDVKPLFEAARMGLDVTTTSRGGEGTTICESLDINAYDVVVVCSGDGLAYEVFNGFGKRPDARKALRKIAVAHIPCGSGNAMSLNLNGSYSAGPSALAVIKGIRTSVDLMSVTQGSERMLSFLSQSVGIIAECDLGTENLRWLGSKRFEIGVAQRIFSQKMYPCDLAIKVAVDGKDRIKAHYKQNHDRERNGHDEIQGPAEAVDDDKEGTGEGLPPLRFGTVNDPLPADWQVRPCDNMGNFYCGNMAWMAPKANFFPAACIDDGYMDVIMNDGDISPLSYIGLMTSVESNKHFNKELLSYWKVVAYRLTPREQDDGYISIDGERVPFQPFQVEIHPGLGTVLSKSGRYEADGPPGWENSV